MCGVKYKEREKIKREYFHHKTDVYIKKELFKKKMCKEWRSSNYPEDHVFNYDNEFETIFESIRYNNIPNWATLKSNLKNETIKEQIEEWKNDVHGRIYKRYVDGWKNNKKFYDVYKCTKTIIRKLRLGCSELVDHKSYLYKTPIFCPSCSKKVVETNEHFFEE